MINPTREQIENAYWALPEEVRRFLYAEEAVVAMDHIGKKFALSEDHIATLASLNGEVVMGLIHLDAFAGEIRQRLNIDMIKAYDIAKEVSLSIFSKITPWMEKVHGGEKVGEAPAGPKPEVPSPKPETPKVEPPPAQPLTETKESLIQKETSDKTQVTGDKQQVIGTPDTYREPIPPEDLPVVESPPSSHVVDLRQKENESPNP